MLWVLWVLWVDGSVSVGRVCGTNPQQDPLASARLGLARRGSARRPRLNRNEQGMRLRRVEAGDEGGQEEGVFLFHSTSLRGYHTLLPPRHALGLVVVLGETG